MGKLIATALSFAVLTGSLAVLAHEGDHEILGNVTAVHDKHLEIKTKDSKTVSITLDEKTKFLRGKATATAGGIKVGERVVVNVGSGKEPLVAKEVRLGPPGSPAK